MLFVLLGCFLSHWERMMCKTNYICFGKPHRTLKAKKVKARRRRRKCLKKVNTRRRCRNKKTKKVKARRRRRTILRKP